MGLEMDEKPHTCCDRRRVMRGIWSTEEDEKLINCISTFGQATWSAIPGLAGLDRCGKSCRLRWLNYLRPGLNKENFNSDEMSLIIQLHKIMGNRWAQIVKHLPGRTDNEVKNFCNSSRKRKLSAQLQKTNNNANLSSNQQRKLIPIAPRFTHMNNQINNFIGNHDYMTTTTVSSPLPTAPSGYSSINHFSSSSSSSSNNNVPFCYVPQPASHSEYQSHHQNNEQTVEDCLEHEIASVFFSTEQPPQSIDQLFEPTNHGVSGKNDLAQVFHGYQ